MFSQMSVLKQYKTKVPNIRFQVKLSTGRSADIRVYTEYRTDRETDNRPGNMMQLIGVLRDYEKVPNKKLSTIK